MDTEPLSVLLPVLDAVAEAVWVGPDREADGVFDPVRDSDADRLGVEVLLGHANATSRPSPTASAITITLALSIAISGEARPTYNGIGVLGITGITGAFQHGGGDTLSNAPRSVGADPAKVGVCRSNGKATRGGAGAQLRQGCGVEKLSASSSMSSPMPWRWSALRLSFSSRMQQQKTHAKRKTTDPTAMPSTSDAPGPVRSERSGSKGGVMFAGGGGGSTVCVDARDGVTVADTLGRVISTVEEGGVTVAARDAEGVTDPEAEDRVLVGFGCREAEAVADAPVTVCDPVLEPDPLVVVREPLAEPVADSDADFVGDTVPDPDRDIEVVFVVFVEFDGAAGVCASTKSSARPHTTASAFGDGAPLGVRIRLQHTVRVSRRKAMSSRRG
jgi:hypothetical protein